MERNVTKISVSGMERDGTEITVTGMEPSCTEIPVSESEGKGMYYWNPTYRIMYKIPFRSTGIWREPKGINGYQYVWTRFGMTGITFN